MTYDPDDARDAKADDARAAQRDRWRTAARDAVRANVRADNLRLDLEWCAAHPGVVWNGAEYSAFLETLRDSDAMAESMTDAQLDEVWDFADFAFDELHANDRHPSLTTAERNSKW